MKEGNDQDEIYEFVEETPRPVLPVKPLENTQQPTRSPLQYRSKANVSALSADPEIIKDIQMPMRLLAGGVAIEILTAFFQSGSAGASLVYVGIELIFGTAIMLAGILIAAKFRGIDLGKFWIATFKLAAIAVAPTAVVDLASPVLKIIPFGALLGLGVEFLLYFALLGALFDLDESDTWYCVCVIFLMRLAVYFAFLALLATWR